MEDALSSAATPGAVVIDTNVALDLLVFGDPAVQALHAALRAGTLRWLSTADMRAELARVLHYPRIAPRLAAAGLHEGSVLAGFDALTVRVPAPPPCAARCRDPDDQPFIDLAVHCCATLLSKDACVLGLARHLAPLGVTVRRRWP
ncbi:putative toxin-antitoxin system toxin component, PIN family [Ottowia testudinis]|uniref:Toxin-antitoxin system toxin component, PIN family n=1 Tax=Ottowia testudinis TaxID=2816950 RepID=A0A975CK08_9BURK|nr:putative toxin-antitoxin system toxin component, PIN family [Ottowia testudinis]